jgi:hypothetical protein
MCGSYGRSSSVQTSCGRQSKGRRHGRSRRAQFLTLLMAAALATTSLLVLAACADVGDPRGEPVTPTASSPEPTDEPTDGGDPTIAPSMSETPTKSDASATISPPKGPPSTNSLSQFRARCLAQTTNLDRATLFFDDHVDLKLSTAHRFTMALGVPGSLGPAQAGPAQSEVELACTVQARLIASSDALEVTPADWVAGQYVPPEPTTWTWVVTSKAPGTTEAVLQLKPVIRTTRSDGLTSLEDLRTEEYNVSFRTARSAGERVSAAWKWAVGFAGGLAVILGLLATVRSLHRQPDSASPAGRDRRRKR